MGWIFYTATIMTILMIVLIKVVIMSFRLLAQAKDTKKQALMFAKKIEETTKLKLNAIAGLTPKELDLYLGELFAQCMEIERTLISSVDPDGKSVLYVTSLNRLITYLGPINVQAIEYYYGEDYIIRWCEMRYLQLEIKGKLGVIGMRDLNPTTDKAMAK